MGKGGCQDCPALFRTLAGTPSGPVALAAWVELAEKTPDSRRSEADTAKRRGASGRKSRDIRSVEVTVVKTTFLGEEAAKAFRYLFGRLKFVALIVTDDWDAAVVAHATGFFDGRPPFLASQRAT